MEGRESQLDDLEALVVSVISGTRALRRNGRWGWDQTVRGLQSRVAALARQLEELRQQQQPVHDEALSHSR